MFLTVLIYFITSIVLHYCAQSDAQIPKANLMTCLKPVNEIIPEVRVRENTTNLNELKFPGPDGLHSTVQKQLVKEMAELLLIMFENSRRRGPRRMKNK